MSPAPVAAVPPLGGCRVLLVDDDGDVRRLLAEQLRRAGAEVTERGHGRSGVAACVAEALSGRPFDAVVVDLRMPGMQGSEVAATLRINGYEGVIVGVSALVTGEAAALWTAAGCDAVLDKSDCRVGLVSAVAAARRRAR